MLKKEQRPEYDRKYRESRKAKGICIICGKPAIGGATECVSCREKRKADFARRSAEKKARGECGKCPLPAVEGTTLCEGCTAKMKAGASRLRQERRGIGLCKDCGKPSLKGKSQCSSCSKKASRRAIKARDVLIETGSCIQCGGIPEPGYARCVSCLENSRGHLARRKIRLEESGMCRRCGKDEPAAGKLSCIRCILADAAMSHLKSRKYAGSLLEIFESQGGVCPYLGVPIEIGVDAEIDHIIPRAMGGADDLDNLQWVHVWANVMKADLDEGEFLGRLDSILPAMMKGRERRQGRESDGA